MSVFGMWNPTSGKQYPAEKWRMTGWKKIFHHEWMSRCRSSIGFDGGGFSRWVILVFRGSLWPVEGSLRPVFHCGTWEWGPSHPMMSFFERRHDIIDMMPEGVRANKVPETLGISKYPEKKNRKWVLEPRWNTEVESPPYVRICNCNSYAS